MNEGAFGVGVLCGEGEEMGNKLPRYVFTYFFPQVSNLLYQREGNDTAVIHQLQYLIKPFGWMHVIPNTIEHH